MFLDKIVNHKKLTLQEKKKTFPLEEVKKLARNCPPVRDFKESLKNNTGREVIIAEIKRASPSKGLICKEEEPENRALVYQESGAAAISVLTEEKYFLGSLKDLNKVKSAVDIPVLRKDFIVDQYQLYESRGEGADAVLLITSILPDIELSSFIEICRKLSMAALVEVHTRDELQRALACGAEIIGINNRNLETFQTNIKVTIDLCSEVPPDVLLISESGIGSNEDIKKLKEKGVYTFLIGEALMDNQNPGQKIKELLYGKS